MGILGFFQESKKQEKIESKESILVVDDNLELLEMLKKVKLPASMNIIYAESAKEAVKHLHESNIVAILADITMPNQELLDYEIAKMFSKIPVFRMSGNHSHYTNLMLHKPFSTNAYRDVLIQLECLGKMSKAA